MQTEKKQLLMLLPPFDPQQGTIIFHPEKNEPGYWAGAPSIIFDTHSQKYLCTFRMRRPRGTKPDRGHLAGIAASTDGANFKIVWHVTSDMLNHTPSMERFCLVTVPQKQVYRLFLSFVDSETNQWRIDVVESELYDKWDMAMRKKVFVASDLPAEGVKDPIVMFDTSSNLWHMYVSYSPCASQANAALHNSADVFNTGLVKSHTGFATSVDGIHFTFVGDCLSPSSDKWDKFCARLATVTSIQPQGVSLPYKIAFYDGSDSVEKNYEEQASMCLVHDHHIQKVQQGPWITNSNSVRYMSAIHVNSNEWWFFYEFTKSDGSHDLRKSVVNL